METPTWAPMEKAKEPQIDLVKRIGKWRSRKPSFLFKGESFAIIGACFEVYNEMGSGYVEPVYQECLKMELQSRGIPFSPKPTLQLNFKGMPLEQTYEPDFDCYDKIIVEIKAVSSLNDQFRAQVHNYLKATGYRLGLLVNFGEHPDLVYERIVR